jgi:hypothetical protein
MHFKIGEKWGGEKWWGKKWGKMGSDTINRLLKYLYATQAQKMSAA